MLTISLYDKPIAAWLGKAGPSAIARFLRHHVHDVVCSCEPVFTDDPDVTFGGIKLHDLPVGSYSFYGSERGMQTIVSTPTLIAVEGVKVIETPDKTKISISSELLALWSAMFHKAPNAKIAVFTYMWERKDISPGVVLQLGGGIDTRFQPFLISQGVPTHLVGHEGTDHWKFIGILDIVTGHVNPWPEQT